MMKNYIKSTLAIFAIALTWGTTSCMKDLDAFPIDPSETTPDKVYLNEEAYKQVLAKCYAGLAVSGQIGPAGAADISGIDEGFSTYLRQYFKVQELTTDEAICAWNDGNLRDYHDLDWNSQNEFVTAMYNRIYYQIVLVNEFIRETTDEKLASRGQDAIKTQVAGFRNEARFLRALSYYHALDLFGNVPFVTEDNAIGSTPPNQISKADLYAWLETELKDLEGKLVAPQSNEYGRVDQAAAWMLLSRLYLNAEVYTGTANYADAATYAEKVINSSYSLAANYQDLFLADNDVNGAQNEVIFAVLFDGAYTQTYGGMTYIVHAQVGGAMNIDDYGVNSGWGGNRATKQFAQNFGVDFYNSTDDRAMFAKQDQDDVDNIFDFKQGVAVTKFKNLNKDGSLPSGGNEFASGDFPVMRLAEAYLIYAEAAANGSGDQAKALGYLNALRDRAGLTNDHYAALNMDNVKLERSRELYWEMHRRTDLIRWNLLTGSTYIWNYKGGVPAGVAVDDKYNYLPLPSADVNANPNLVQNSGY